MTEVKVISEVAFGIRLGVEDNSVVAFATKQGVEDSNGVRPPLLHISSPTSKDMWSGSRTTAEMSCGKQPVRSFVLAGTYYVLRFVRCATRG
jgi:hypothetical protein